VTTAKTNICLKWETKTTKRNKNKR